MKRRVGGSGGDGVGYDVVDPLDNVNIPRSAFVPKKTSRTRGKHSPRFRFNIFWVVICLILAGTLCFLALHQWNAAKNGWFRRDRTSRNNLPSKEQDLLLTIPTLSGIPCHLDYENSKNVLDTISVVTSPMNGGVGNDVRTTTTTTKKQPKVLCFMMTHSGYHTTRVAAVLNTWGTKCDKLLIASNVTDETLGTIGFETEATYENLWKKLNETIQYIWDHYRNEYDWFYKVDDDTFVIMENLKYFLSTTDQVMVTQVASSNDEAAVYGHILDHLPYNFFLNWPEYDTPDNQRFLDYFFNNVATHNSQTKYLAGGSGYVMNQRYLNEFKEALEGPLAPRGCPQEDFAHGMTMLARGIEPKSSVDKTGRERFIPEPPDLWSYIHQAKVRNGEIAASLENQPTAVFCVSFHHIQPKQMKYMYDQLYSCRSSTRS